MRSTTLAIAGLLVSVVSGVGLPACANSCVSGFGSCNNLDVKCICSSTTLIATLACCVSTACDAADQEKTIQFANALCAGQGVTTLPQSATCAPGVSTGLPSATASSATATGTSTGTASSAAASVSSAIAAAATAPSASTSVSAVSSAPTASASGNVGTSNKVENYGLGMLAAGILAIL